MKHFILVLLIGLCLPLTSCTASNSGGGQEQSIQAVYKACMESLNDYRMSRNVASIDTAEMLAEKMMQNDRALGPGLTAKVQVLVYRKKFDEAEKLMKEKNVGRYTLPENMFPDFSASLAEYILALKAQDHNESDNMRQHLLNSEKIMSNEIYSSHFDLKNFFENEASYSQETIFKMLILQKWCSTLNFLGGAEKVKSELNKIIKRYSPSESSFIYQLYNSYGYTSDSSERLSEEVFGQ